MVIVFTVVCVVAFLASALTFFSGFGLGTLLLPAFALFFPIQQAVALTAIVHFLNGVFKVGLVGRHADLSIVIRFGVPAIAASFAGAWALVWLAGLEPLLEYSTFGHRMQIMPVKLVVGLLLLVFSLVEFLPRFRHVSFGTRFMPLGGLISGFFGGLSGTQGALRSAFLVRANLSKEVFVGTGVVVSLLVDISRLALYFPAILANGPDIHYGLLSASVMAAFAGAWLGNRYLKKATMEGIQLVVAIMLFVVAVGLMAGVL
jgi:uncharacterized protein